MKVKALSACELLLIYRKAKELIAVPEHWTQGDYARAAYLAEPCWPTEERAMSFCAIGAILRVTGHDESDKWSSFSPCLQPLRRHVANINGDIAAFNDEATHKEVLAAYDAAIHELEAECVCSICDKIVSGQQTGPNVPTCSNPTHDDAHEKERNP